MMEGLQDPNKPHYSPLGPHEECIGRMTAGVHRLRLRNWMTFLQKYNFRHDDATHSDVPEFAYSSTLDLIASRNAFGCLPCQEGRCERIAHNSTS